MNFAVIFILMQGEAILLKDARAFVADPEVLARKFHKVRGFTERLIAPLSSEDCQIQSMLDASPTKWHLAHVTWFFETFILVNYMKGYQRFNEDFNYLYNSYYNGIGKQFPRHQRGLVTRPSLAEIKDYRAFVDLNMAKIIGDTTHPYASSIAFLTELGAHHEQQHQELILTDIKHGFSMNTYYPAYCAPRPTAVEKASKLRFVNFSEGIYSIGDAARTGFAYDNERPAHKRWLDKFQLASRLVTNREYQEFMGDGGYEKAELWLSEGWYFITKNQRKHPGYWVEKDDRWYHFTLSGLLPLGLEEPVCHLNFYEAQAYATWAQARLPSEAEWEVAAQPFRDIDVAEPERFHPKIAAETVTEAVRQNLHDANGLEQMIGELWQWTSSGYEPYPGFVALEGVAGEYNGKFMCNQYVLRGGSCITAQEHIRITYRNFFPTNIDWQFTGLRLARNGNG